MSWSRGPASRPKWPHFALLLLPQNSQLLSDLMGSAFMRIRLMGEGAVVGQPGLVHYGI